MSLLRQAISNSYHEKQRQEALRKKEEALRQQEIRLRERREALERDVPFEIQLQFLNFAEFGLDEDIPKVKKLLEYYRKLAIIDDLSVDKELTDILISDEDEADGLLREYEYRLLQRKGSYNALMYFIRNKNITQKQKLINALIHEGSHVLMNYINVPMSNAFLQKIGFSFCVTRGVYSGGNPEARKKSFSLAKSFIKKTLLK